MEVNEVVQGFRIIRIREVPEVKGTMVEMVHEKTQAKAIWLKRDDENKTFSIAFKTTPTDNTGVFHINEHSVLNGSKRYPVREPFVDLLKGSLQTFLNAMTYPDKTVYPVSSRNDQDFINLMRVYLDAVFYPLAMSDPNIFYQEGWHYELNDKNADPIYKGVVFNEMKGAYSSPAGLKETYLLKGLFPDTCYGYDSGGDPEEIPDLTYEGFCAAHARYYNPSNSYIFLDGEMDIEKILGIIDQEYLKDFTAQGEPVVIQKQQPVATRKVMDYEIGAEEPAEHKAHISFGYVTGQYDDYVRNEAFAVLSDVLCGSNESPLKKAILQNGLGEDVSFSLVDELLQPYVQLDVVNTDVDKEAEVKRTLRSTLEQLVKDGLDRRELEASLNKREFKARERDFGSAPKGLVFALTSLDSWLYGGDPVDSITFDPVFAELRKDLDTRYFEELIEKYILNSEHKTELVLVPSNTLGKEKARKEAAKLKAAKESWSQQQVDDLIAMNAKLSQWQKTADTPEQQATLPKLHLSDLQKQPKAMEAKVSQTEDRITVLDHELDTDGISYLRMYFNADDLNEKQITEASLMLNLLGDIATGKYSTVLLNQQINSLLGDFDAGLSASAPVDHSAVKAMVFVSWSMLTRNDEKANELVKEVLYHTTFNDAEAIHDIIKQNLIGLEQKFLQAGNMAALIRCSSYYSEYGVIVENAEGYEAYRFLKDVDEHWAEKGQQLIAEMKELYHKLFTRSRLTLSVTGEHPDQLKQQILSDMPEGEAVVRVAKKPLGNKKEGIVMPSNVSYAAQSDDIYALARGRNGTMAVLANILTYDYLWNRIRVQGGAYGCGFRGAVNTGLFFSYRDPDPANSLNVFAATPDYLRQFVKENSDVEKYVIGASGDYNPLLASNQRKIQFMDANYFTGNSYAFRCEIWRQLVNTTSQDIEKAVEVFEKITQDGYRCVVGNKDAIDKCRDKLEDIHEF